MNKKIKLMLFVIIGTGFCYATAEFMQEKQSGNLDMMFVQDSSYCRECHTEDSVGKFSDPAKACHQFCLKCHNNMRDHHPLDVRMEFSASMILPLFKNSTVTCFTCHDLNNGKHDIISWKAQNFFQRIFNKKKRYKTYYLRLNNRSGKLCKQCH